MLAGTMLINEILDYERVRSYEMEVYAIQRNEFRKPLSDKCSVLINVTDANDNAPYFPQGIIERDIPEDTQHGVSVYVVSISFPQCNKLSFYPAGLQFQNQSTQNL